MPYPSIGQCPVEYPTPPIDQKQMSKFGQFDRFWSRGWVAYTTPTGFVKSTLCQDLGNLIFQLEMTKDQGQTKLRTQPSTRWLFEAY